MTDTVMFIIFGIPMAILTWVVAVIGAVLLYRMIRESY